MSKPNLTVPAPVNKNPLAAEAIAFAKAHTTWAEGMCEQFVREALQQEAKYLTAAAQWLAAPAAHRHTYWVPPVGVPVHFSTHNPSGHVALSAGGGYVYSTDMSAAGYEPGHVALVSLAQVEKSMNGSYLGWLDTCEGVSVYHG